MMEMKGKNIKVALFSFIFGGLLFFLIGKFSSQYKMENSLEYGQVYNGSVNNDQLKLIKEESVDNPVLPLKRIEIRYRDTGRTETKYIYQVVDTAAIIADYVLKRTYDIIAFDDMDKGKLRLFPVIQYNKLEEINYEFTPVRRTSIYKEKVWQPFISGSYSTLDIVGFGGGLFYHKLGFEYQYQIDYKNMRKGHLLELKYRF